MSEKRLRERIENLILSDLSGERKLTFRYSSGETVLSSSGEAFVSDILYLFREARPEPDRERLEILLGSKNCSGFHSESGLENSVLWRFPKLVDELMAWYRGEKKDPEWCEHFEWDKDAWLYKESWVGGDREGLWRLKKSCRWDICPIKGCHKPRPE